MLDVGMYMISFQIAVVSYVFCCVLMDQDYIFEWYGDFLTNIINSGHKWLAFPLGYCEKCFGGQAALWIWLYYYHDLYTSGDTMKALFCHICFVCLTILFIILIKTSLKRWK